MYILDTLVLSRLSIIINNSTKMTMEPTHRAKYSSGSGNGGASCATRDVVSVLVHQRDYAARYMDAMGHKVLHRLLDTLQQQHTNAHHHHYTVKEIREAGEAAVREELETMMGHAHGGHDENTMKTKNSRIGIGQHTAATATETVGDDGNMDSKQVLLFPWPTSGSSYKGNDDGTTQMRCPYCAWNNPRDGKYCGGCGGNMQTTRGRGKTHRENANVPSSKETAPRHEGSSSVASTSTTTTATSDQPSLSSQRSSSSHDRDTDRPASTSGGKSDNATSSDSRNIDETNKAASTSSHPEISTELRKKVDVMNHKQLKNVVKMGNPSNMEHIFATYGKEEMRKEACRLLAANPSLLDDIEERKRTRAVEHVQNLNVKGLREIILTAGYTKEYLSENGIVEKDSLREIAIRLVNQNPQLIRLATSGRRGNDSAAASSVASSSLGSSEMKDAEINISAGLSSAGVPSAEETAASGSNTPASDEAEPSFSPAEIRAAEQKWVQARDEHGREYFYHFDTRATRWEKPTGMLAAKIESRVQADQKAAEERSQSRLRQLQESEQDRSTNSAHSETIRASMSEEVDKWARKAGWPGNKVNISKKKLKGRDPSDILAKLLAGLPDLISPYIQPNNESSFHDFKESAKQLENASSSDRGSLLKRTYFKCLRVVHPDKMSVPVEGESSETRIKRKAVAEFAFSVISTCNNYSKNA